jgi:hypothetical protein
MPFRTHRAKDGRPRPRILRVQLHRGKAAAALNDRPRRTPAPWHRRLR